MFRNRSKDDPAAAEDASDAPSMGRIVDGVHRLGVRVYYEDTDFSGVVYHASYLRFLERGRSDFLRCAGVHHAELLQREDPLVFAIRKITVTYEQPARVDDALLVLTRYTDVKGARLFIEQELHRDGERLLTADVEGVCLHPDGRPRRAPKEVSAAIEPLLTRSTS